MFVKNRYFWVVALLGLVLDRASKFWLLYAFSLPLPPPTLTQQELERYSRDLMPVVPGVFHLAYGLNKGAAFSIFPDGVGWLRWLSLGVGIGLLIFAWFGPTLSRWEQLGYGFILSGALGNGIDRFIWGYVVDFLSFRLIRFPVFNVADTFINVGIACFLIAAFQKPARAGGKEEGRGQRAEGKGQQEQGRHDE
jgi:signal peptidase II